MAGLRIEGNHLVAGGDREDARLLPIRPVRNSTAVLADAVSALALVEAARPDGFTGIRIRRDDGAAAAAPSNSKA
jgi:hypothetical protein